MKRQKDQRRSLRNDDRRCLHAYRERAERKERKHADRLYGWTDEDRR